MKLLLRRLSIAAAVALVSAACGGSDEGGLFGGSGGSSGGSAGTSGSGGGGATGGSAGTDGGVTGGAAGTGGGQTGGAAGTGTGGGGTGGAAGAGGSGGDPGWTLANVCEKLPPLICADREQCCVQAFGFDKANCQANEKNDCEAQVKLVQANQATFHPENIDACLQAVKPLLGACFFQGDLYASLLKTSNLCRSIFDGMKTPGTQCSEDTECQTAPGPNGYSGCGSQSQQCYQGSVKQQGEGCDNNTICEQGLSCKFSGGSNNCQPAAQPGAGCFQSSDCALGYYCAGGKCTTAKPAGESCFNFQHCQSLSCSGGKCGEQRPYVNQAGCGK